MNNDPRENLGDWCTQIDEANRGKGRRGDPVSVAAASLYDHVDRIEAWWPPVCLGALSSWCFYCIFIWDFLAVGAS